MSLNDITLNSQLLQGLYRQALVVAGQPASRPSVASEKVERVTPEVKAPAQVPLQVLGNNNRRFVILVNYPDLPYLPDDSFQFLGSVLKACQLNAADVAILNLARQEVSLTAIYDQLHPLYLVAFGRQTGLEGWPGAPDFNPQTIGNTQLLQAPALETLNQPGDAAKPLKKQLWEALKQMLQL